MDVKEREKVGCIYIGNLETVMVARDGGVALGIGRGRANECCVELPVSWSENVWVWLDLAGKLKMGISSWR